MTAQRKRSQRSGSAAGGRRFIVRSGTWGAPVTGLAWCRTTAAFALGDGTVRFWAAGAVEPQRVVEAHSGPVLSWAPAPDGQGLVTGGDDGLVVHTREDGARERLASTGGRWVDHVAVAPAGALAWAHGRCIEIANARTRTSRTITLPSSCGGLAFEPEGKRLALAHYGGVTLANAADPSAEPERLDWKGSHIGAVWSPDGRYLLTTMQEQAVHIWRLPEGDNLHMGGYSAKPRCLVFSPNGRRLATSGGSGAVVWPFEEDTGPQGRRAEELAPREGALVTALAWHPVSDILATGWSDGVVRLVVPGSDRYLELREGCGAAIAHLGWCPDGVVLAFGTEDGAAGLVDCSGMKES